MSTEPKSWYVECIPWVNSPIKLSLVVLTAEGQERAIEMFREFYKNTELEISDVRLIHTLVDEAIRVEG